MFIGLDLGTTNVKALVVAADGNVLARGEAGVSLRHVGAGGVEQDIEEIWSATLSAICHVVDATDVSSVAAIGVSSQGGAIQIQTPDRKPAGPVISWLDCRGRPYDRKLESQLGIDWFASHTGHGGSCITPGQLGRLRADGSLPENFRVGFVGDVIVSRLTGRAAHDATSLSLAMLYNPSLQKADGDLLAKLDITEDRLPDLIDPLTPAGVLLDEVARATSLPAGVPVSAAIHDQYTAALGAGVVHSGDVMFGAGTAWVLLAIDDRLTAPVINTAFVCTHAIDGLYGQILSLVNGGSAFGWALRTLNMEDRTDDEIDAILQQAPPGSDGLRFWPLMTAGGGAGLVDGTQGRLDGLNLSHTPPHVLRAVIEGLAMELARYVAFLTHAGLNVKRLVMCGGAASSSVTPQIIADVTGLPVATTSRSETSALGAAVIARGIVTQSADLAALSVEMTPPVHTICPGQNMELYGQCLQEYLASVPVSH